MSAPGIDPRVLDALQSASSLELFQLSTLIERLLAGLDAGNLDLAAQIASVPEHIRGYGHVKEPHQHI